jgi:hypothetical protein
MDLRVSIKGRTTVRHEKQERKVEGMGGLYKESLWG